MQTLLTLCLLAVVQPSPSPYGVLAAACYVREPSDRAWHVRLSGEVPSLCGAYVLVHDVQGRPIYHDRIPHGMYPTEKPFTVDIPADGITGDYKIVLVGHQNDHLGLIIPRTDLPYEVYGGSNFSIGHDAAAIPYFQTPEGVATMKLGAYRGHLRVLDAAGRVVADTHQGGKPQKLDTVVEFRVEPSVAYHIERDCFYFRSYTPGALFITSDPARWFRPTPKLDEVKWWELVK